MWFVFKRLDEKKDRVAMKQTDVVEYSRKSASSRKSSCEQQSAADVEQYPTVGPTSSTVEME